MYKESVRRPLENDLGPQCSSTLYLFADLFNYYIRPISPERNLYSKLLNRATLQVHNLAN